MDIKLEYIPLKNMRVVIIKKVRYIMQDFFDSINSFPTR